MGNLLKADAVYQEDIENIHRIAEKNGYKVVQEDEYLYVYEADADTQYGAPLNAMLIYE